MEKVLKEHLEKGDLAFLVSETLEIDRYEPRFDNSVVITIKVNDKSAARDLAKFLQNLMVEAYDVDYSETLNDSGYYHVYVEVETKMFEKRLHELLDYLENLTLNNMWFAKVGRRRFSYLLNDRNIEKIGSSLINKSQKNITYNELAEWLSGSKLPAHNIEFPIIDIITQNHEIYDIEGFVKEREFDDFISYNKIKMRIDEHAYAESKRLQNCFGYEYKVDLFEEFILVRKLGSDKVLILRKKQC